MIEARTRNFIQQISGEKNRKFVIKVTQIDGCSSRKCQFPGSRFTNQHSFDFQINRVWRLQLKTTFIAELIVFAIT